MTGLLLALALTQTPVRLGPTGMACPSGQAIQIVTGTRERGRCVAVGATGASAPAGNTGDLQTKAGATTLGAYAGTGAAPASQWVRSLSSAGAATWAQPSWTDIANVPATFAPAAHVHAAGDVTSGVLAGARGGVGVALPTCSGTDKLTANGTQVSCSSDVAGGSGGDDGERVYLGSTGTCSSTGTTLFTFSYQASRKVHFSGLLFAGAGSGSLYVRCAPSGNVSSLGLAAEGSTGASGNPTSWTAVAATATTSAAQVGSSAWGSTNGAISYRGWLYQSGTGGSGTVTCECIGSGNNITYQLGTWHQVHTDN